MRRSKNNLFKIVIFLSILLCNQEIFHAHKMDNSKEKANTKKHMYYKNNFEEELQERVLYESFIPLESLLFLIEINKLSEKGIQDFVKRTVFKAKNYIEKIDPQKIQELIQSFHSLSANVSTVEKDLADALRLRNSYFEKDESQIAKKLFLNNYEKIIKDLNAISLKEKIKVKDFVNKQYLSMLSKLRKAAIEGNNLVRAILRERKEFTRNFFKEDKFLKETMVSAKTIINLGGSVFEPNILLQIFYKLIVNKRDDFIKKHVTSILKPVEKLKQLNKNKTNTEKREEILDFLKACKEKRGWAYKNLIDEAFKSRSLIVEEYLKTDDEGSMITKEKALDEYHENFLISLIDNVEGFHEDSFENFLIIDTKITDAYIEFLQSGQKKAEDKLLRFFKSQS